MVRLFKNYHYKDGFVNRNSIPFTLLLIILASCAAPKTEILTPIPATPTQVPTANTIVMPYIGDGGLISEKPCAAPCFFGIRIGETRLDQGVSILMQNGISLCNQVTATEITCGNSGVWANPVTAIVDSVNFYPSNTISIGEIILKYGQPDIMHVIPTSTPEHPTITIILFFDKLKMRVILPDTDTRVYAISKSSKIESISYFDDTLYTKLREDMFSQPWNGYGNYDRPPD